jgi:hypothetical protein
MHFHNLCGLAHSILFFNMASPSTFIIYVGLPTVFYFNVGWPTHFHVLRGLAHPVLFFIVGWPTHFRRLRGLAHTQKSHPKKALSLGFELKTFQERSCHQLKT